MDPDLKTFPRYVITSIKSIIELGAYYYGILVMHQVIIFASVHVFTPDSTRGYLLLQLIRSYLELDMCAGLTLHTEKTLEAGETELRTFEALVKVFNLSLPCYIKLILYIIVAISGRMSSKELEFPEGSYTQAYV